MARTPEDINLEALLGNSDIEVDIAQLEMADTGFSSTVFFTDQHAVKLLRQVFPTSKSANAYADALYGEQDTIMGYLTPANIAAAHFVIGQTSGKDYRVLLVQDRIIGTTMGDESIDQKPGLFVDYLSSALKMYRRTGKIPDLACIERRFNPLNDPNTQVASGVDGVLTPVLIDTTYGRLQRQRYTGPLICKGIAWGVQKALDNS